MIKLISILKEMMVDKELVNKALKDIRTLGQINPINSREIIFEDGIVSLEVNYFDGHLWISSIYTDIENRNQGKATKVMQDICNIADKYQVPISMGVSPFGKSSNKLNKSQLMKWYTKFGFKNIGFGDMERIPQI